MTDVAWWPKIGIACAQAERRGYVRGLRAAARKLRREAVAIEDVIASQHDDFSGKRSARAHEVRRQARELDRRASALERKART
jgi:hypothetical protein